jgi:isocitrate dehydrogenase (NAD+)
MSYKITLIPGDGIGPEVTEATRRVLEATGVQFTWDVGIIGEKALPLFGTPLPDDVLTSIKRNKVALKGPVTTPIGTGFRSVNVALRKSLDLYACVRPCKTYRGAPTSFRNVDIIVVRENTEDLYAGIEFAKSSAEAKKLEELIQTSTNTKVNKDSSFSIKVISETGSRRIVKYAFNYARANNRKKVTVGHKANILKFTDGLFLSVAREIAGEYTDIEFEETVIDALCMRLVTNPQSFDVIALPNLYGDIVSDLCAGLIGGLGLAPGANIGDGVAVFEPTHGSAPKHTGHNRVNPMAMMLSAVMMLRYLEERNAADRLEDAIASVIAEGKDITYDLKPKQGRNPAGTSDVADAVINKLKEDCLVAKTE